MVAFSRIIARSTVLAVTAGIVLCGCSKESSKEQAKGQNSVPQRQPGPTDDTEEKTQKLQEKKPEPELKKPERAELKRDPKLEASLAAEREKKRQAIAALERQFVPKLAELPPQIKGTNRHKYLAFLSTKNVARAAVFSPNGKFVAVGDTNHTEIWDLEAAKSLRTLKANGDGRVAFSPDSRTLATVGSFRDSKFQLWDVETGNLKFELEHGSGICGLHFSGDGKQILSASFIPGLAKVDFTVKHWSLETGRAEKEVYLLRQADLAPVKGLFSLDGERFAGAVQALDNIQGEVAVWRTKDGVLLRKKTTNAVRPELAFSPDGWRLAVHPIEVKSGALIDWDLETDKASVVAEIPLSDPLLYSVDGRFLMFGSPVQIWRGPDQKAGKPSSDIQGAPLALSPGGTFLLTTRRHLWRLDSIVNDK